MSTETHELIKQLREFAAEPDNSMPNLTEKAADELERLDKANSGLGTIIGRIRDRGKLMGLTSNEVLELTRISPNTPRAIIKIDVSNLPMSEITEILSRWKEHND